MARIDQVIEEASSTDVEKVKKGLDSSKFKGQLIK